MDNFFGPLMLKKPVFEDDGRGGGGGTNRSGGGGTRNTTSYGDVKQNEDGDWYAEKKVTQPDGNVMIYRDYSIDPADNRQGPTFGGNVSQGVATAFSDEVEKAGGSTAIPDLNLDILNPFTPAKPSDLDVRSGGFDASTGAYTTPEVVAPTVLGTTPEVPGFGSGISGLTMPGDMSAFSYDGLTMPGDYMYEPTNLVPGTGVSPGTGTVSPSYDYNLYEPGYGSVFSGGTDSSLTTQPGPFVPLSPGVSSPDIWSSNVQDMDDFDPIVSTGTGQGYVDQDGEFVSYGDDFNYNPVDQALGAVGKFDYDYPTATTTQYGFGDRPKLGFIADMPGDVSLLPSSPLTTQPGPFVPLSPGLDSGTGPNIMSSILSGMESINDLSDDTAIGNLRNEELAARESDNMMLPTTPTLGRHESPDQRKSSVICT